MAKKLTPWFPPEVKPVRVGLYRVKIGAYDNIIEWCWWAGDGWCWAYPCKRDALAKEWKTTEGASQCKAWRGLAERPE